MYGISLYIQGVFVSQKLQTNLLNFYIMTYKKVFLPYLPICKKVGG